MNKAAYKLTKIEAYREADAHGDATGFLANVILTRHPKPTKRLRGMIAFLRAGFGVRLADRSIDTLLIDGSVYPFQTLERASLKSFDGARWREMRDAVKHATRVG